MIFPDELVTLNNVSTIDLVILKYYVIFMENLCSCQLKNNNSVEELKVQISELITFT